MFFLSMLYPYENPSTFIEFAAHSDILIATEMFICHLLILLAKDREKIPWHWKFRGSTTQAIQYYFNFSDLNILPRRAFSISIFYRNKFNKLS